MGSVRSGPSDAARTGGRHGGLETFARLTRLLSAGWSTTFVGVGLASGAQPPPAAVGGAIAAAFAFHLFAFMGNDVVDLPIDRTDPRRAPSPLVRGTVGAPVALTIALAALPAAMGLLALGGASAAARPMTAAVLGLAFYNLHGKAIPVPFVADVAQGVGFAFLVLAGASAAGGATARTGWAMATVATLIAFANGFHGALRDAENDAASGARTTALLLGARASAGRGIELPGGLVLVGVLLQVVLGLLLAGPVVLGLAGVVAGAASMGLYAASTWTIARAYVGRGDLRRTLSLGSWSLSLLLLALLALYLPRLDLLAGALVVCAFAVPLLIYDRAVRGTACGLPGTEAAGPQAARTAGRAGGRERRRALWRMTRPGNWQVAAVLTAVGGAVVGGPLPRFVLAAAAGACVVTAANVFNDRCDVAADLVNRPDRPLPAGLVSANDADRVVLAVSVGAVAFAAPLGAADAALAGALLVVGLCYSVRLRAAGVLGPLTVGGAFAALIPLGGLLVSGELHALHALVSGLVLTLVFARESLKAVPDIPGDSAAGYDTVATRYGRAGALALFRAGCVAFLAGLLLPVLLGAAGVAYLTAAVVCVAIPTGIALWTVRADPRDDAIESALQLTGRVFGLGLIPMLLLAASGG